MTKQVTGLRSFSAITWSRSHFKPFRFGFWKPLRLEYILVGCVLPACCLISQHALRWGGVWSRGCLPLVRGGVYPSIQWGRPPTCGQNSWHTFLKILPCPNFVAGGKKPQHLYWNCHEKIPKQKQSRKMKARTWVKMMVKKSPRLTYEETLAYLWYGSSKHFALPGCLHYHGLVMYKSSPLQIHVTAQKKIFTPFSFW